MAQWRNGAREQVRMKKFSKDVIMESEIGT